MCTYVFCFSPTKKLNFRGCIQHSNWLYHAHSHRFVWSLTVDWLYLNVLCLMPPLVQSSQPNMIFYHTTTYFTTTSRRKTGKVNSKMMFLHLTTTRNYKSATVRGSTGKQTHYSSVVMLKTLKNKQFSSLFML